MLNLPVLASLQEQRAADARAQHLVTNWQRRDAELPDAIPPGCDRDEDYVVGPLWDRGALRAIANGSMPVTEVLMQPRGWPSSKSLCPWSWP